MSECSCSAYKFCLAGTKGFAAPFCCINKIFFWQTSYLMKREKQTIIDWNLYWFSAYFFPVARRFVAVFVTGQHEAIPYLQEDHQVADGLVHHQATHPRFGVSCTLFIFLTNLIVPFPIHTCSYKSRDDFIADVRLIFDNCEIFNEDDSPVGKAGHGMRKYFEVRWAELTDKHSWYQMNLKLMNNEQ